MVEAGYSPDRNYSEVANVRAALKAILREKRGIASGSSDAAALDAIIAELGDAEVKQASLFIANKVALMFPGLNAEPGSLHGLIPEDSSGLRFPGAISLRDARGSLESTWG